MTGILAAIALLLTVPRAVIGGTGLTGRRKPRHRAHRLDHRTGDRTTRGRHLYTGAHRMAVTS